jgi:ubiquinone/menaquinone biosynthesis C-methylase UbiE
MSEKHYNADYLSDTARILKDIKLRSYKYFETIRQGSVVDLGCGTGMDVINMAGMYGSQFKMIGVDHDSSLIEIARKQAGDAPNLEFRIAEGDRLPFADASLSGLRAERLVQHLKDPAAVYQEMNRVLQAEAPVVIVESDWSSLRFYDPAVVIANKLTAFLTETKINNGYAAQHLTHYFEQSGFGTVSLQVFPFVLTSVKDAYTYLWIDKIIAEMAQLGVISEEEKNSFVQHIEAADLKGYFACTMNIVIAAARKH